MGIKHLEPGQVFSSQKELCEYIGMKYKDNTNSRKAQIKEFNRMFKFHKDGRKIIIDKVFDEIKDKIDNRGKSNNSRNNNIYGKYIDSILKNYFTNICKTEAKSKICITLNELAEKCGIININYKAANNHRSKFYKYMNETNDITNITSVNDVFTSLSRKIQSINSSLKRLKNEKIIKYKKTYLVYCINNYRAATNKEIEIIQDAEKEILQEMNINKNRLPYDDILRNRYYRKVNELVSIKMNKVVNICIGFEINILKNDINIECEINEVRRVLNEIINKNTYEKLELKHKKAKSDKNDHKFMKGSHDIILDNQTEDRVDFNYLYNVEKVIDCLVQIRYKNITSFLY